MLNARIFGAICIFVTIGFGHGRYWDLKSEMEPITDSVDSQTEPLIVRARISYGDDIIPPKESIMRLAASHDQDVWKWHKSVITWAVVKPSSKLPLHIVRRAMSEAFDIWSRVISLDFQEVSSHSNADIKVGFERWNHGNHGNFDGPCRQIGQRFEGFVLAHAGYPPSDILHFDDDEQWTYDDPDRLRSGQFVFDLVAVAVHEIGHSLGIWHLTDPNAIMYDMHQQPQFTEDGRLKKVQLTPKDIEAVQSLYGPRKTVGGPPKPNPNPNWGYPPSTIPPTKYPKPIPIDSSRGGDCPKFEAAVTGLDGAAYFFQGGTVWRKSGLTANSGMTSRFHVDHIFPRAPYRVTTAVTSTIGRMTFLFQGRKVFGYSLRTDNTFSLEPGYPKDLDIPFEPEGAFQADNGVLILYRGSKFVIWDNNWNRATFNGDLIQYFPDLPRQTVSLTVEENLYFVNDRDYVVYDIKGRKTLGSKPKNTLIMCSSATSDLLKSHYFVIFFFSVLCSLIQKCFM